MSWSIGEIFNLIDYMPNFRSLDFRKRVIDYVQFEGTITEASRLFRVTRTTIYEWLNLLKSGKSLSPKTPSVRKGYKIDHNAVATYFSDHPDSTQQEVAEVFSTHQSVMGHICKKLKITRKKDDLLSRKG